MDEASRDKRQASEVVIRSDESSMKAFNNYIRTRTLAPILFNVGSLLQAMLIVSTCAQYYVNSTANVLKNVGLGFQANDLYNPRKYVKRQTNNFL